MAKALLIKALSLKIGEKSSALYESLDPNKHWSKQLRFGEDFPSVNPIPGVLPTEHKLFISSTFNSMTSPRLATRLFTIHCP